MFNNNLRKEAIKNHEYAIESYNTTYEIVSSEITGLYNARKKAIGLIHFAENIINSISNTPQEFETKTREIRNHLNSFSETEEVAKEYYENLKQAGLDMATGAGIGVGLASMGPNVLMTIATTFGKAATGTAIRELSGAAAKKAAVAWIGRFLAKFAITEGAGMAVGNAILAWIGPIGWGISAASVGTSLFSLSRKNKKKADVLIDEIKEIIVLKNRLLLMKDKIEDLVLKTKKVSVEIEANKEDIKKYHNADYTTLSNEDKYVLGTLINNAHVLSVLLNETVDGKEDE